MSQMTEDYLKFVLGKSSDKNLNAENLVRDFVNVPPGKEMSKLTKFFAHCDLPQTLEKRIQEADKKPDSDDYKFNTKFGEIFVKRA